MRGNFRDPTSWTFAANITLKVRRRSTHIVDRSLETYSYEHNRQFSGLVPGSHGPSYALSSSRRQCVIEEDVVFRRLPGLECKVPSCLGAIPGLLYDQRAVHRLGSQGRGMDAETRSSSARKRYPGDRERNCGKAVCTTSMDVSSRWYALFGTLSSPSYLLTT